MLDAQGVPQFVAEYFAFNPNINGAFFTASLVTQGVVAKPGASLLYPAIAVNAQQRGGIVFTLVGPNDYSAAAVDNTDGAVWMATEYTPDIARTSLANWCTYVIRLQR